MMDFENREKEGEKDYAYIRVRTACQIDDMKKQDNVKEKCKNRIIIKDIGSGINLGIDGKKIELEESR